jgi:ABC-type amino acid transport system permease subunit
MANIPSIIVCSDHMRVWKVFGCSNFEPIPLFIVVAASFWMLLLGMEI